MRKFLRTISFGLIRPKRYRLNKLSGADLYQIYKGGIHG